jgi:hypothetical protein
MARSEAAAVEWSATPSLSLKGEYNSNLLLFKGNNEVGGHWVSPGVTFKGATESFEVDGTMKGDHVRYYGDRDRSLTNLFFPLRVAYRRDWHTFGFEGGFTRDNTLRGELQQTGLVLSFTQRNLWTASPSWTVAVTERLNWQAGYQFTDATYEDGLRLGLVDYRVHGGTTALLYRLTERDQVHLKGDYVYFETPSLRQKWNSVGIAGGFSHSFSESLTGSVFGGARFVTTTLNFANDSLTDREVVWVYNARIKKEFECVSALAEVSREINPSGFGFLIQTDHVGGALAYRMTETITISVNGGVYFVSGIAAQSVPETRFASVNPRLTWKFAQWWTLDVGYSYAERAVDSLDQWNSANSTFLMLTYGGQKWSVSR